MEVNISPSVSIINVFKALSYESWYALAEYVDNSISSYLGNKDELLKLDPTFQLRIEITIGVDDEIRILDNAGGIALSEFAYAFRPAELPKDRSGLNEFGMGMKTASTWLSNIWTVRTSALGEDVERFIEFDVDHVVSHQLNSLKVRERAVEPHIHYTEIVLSHLTDNAPSKRQIPLISKHLSSIHRKFIQSDEVEIIVNGEPLEYTTPEILKAPLWNNPDGEPLEWKIDIDQQFGSGKRVRGFVALLSQMSSQKNNGFSLFRRGRVIQGSGDELFRPKQLCGSVGSHLYKRIFGELELDGFNVDFSKGKFVGDTDFDLLFDLIESHCNQDSMPLLRQGKNYRKPPPKEDLNKTAKAAKRSFKQDVDVSNLKNQIEEVFSTKIDSQSLPLASNSIQTVESELNSSETISINFEHAGQRWIIKTELISTPGVSEWIKVMERTEVNEIIEVSIQLSLTHRFMSSFAVNDIQPFVRLAMAVGLAEVKTLQEGGGPQGVRQNLNRFLDTVLSA